PEGTRSLEEAQQRKIEHVCRKIRLGPQDHVLDVGCGFGGFLLQAARTTGASGVGLNVVPEQAVWLTQEIERQHLAGRISVRRQDLRDIDGQYD
ncbi:SAM-dependent methyltransferase, partial [Salmonella enterica]|uniref:SAM-dependent methyltransferase n=1 Tax=Salmonella enterica TaxID=28901 RepID=UPI003FD79610